MKNLIVVLFAIFFISIHVVANQNEPENGIQFNHSSWKEIVAQAKKENKLIFLDAYASWCGPCKWMAKNIFTNDGVAEFYNKTFINAKIDMEKGEGIELAKKYSIKNYPTLLYIDANENVLHQTCGVDYVPESSMTFINDGKTALVPEKRLSGLRTVFEKNYANSENSFAFINALDRACAPYNNELKQYFSTQKESNLVSTTNWMMISQFVNDPDSREFNYLFANQNVFAKLYTKDSVDNKIVDVFETGLHSAVRNNNGQDYFTFRKRAQSSGIANIDLLIMNSDMDYYKKKKDWSNYATSAVAYMDKYGGNEAQKLNGVAWIFYENITERKMLEHAEAWALKAVTIEDNYAFNDTYAAVLFKLGKKTDAKNVAEKAIELAKKENTDYQSTSELLEQIKLMQ